MRKSLLTSMFLIIAFVLTAQSQWTYDMYKTVNHKNFRSVSLFSKTYDTTKPDIPLLNAAIFFMMNEERVKHGVAVLDYHPACEIAAYNHSLKMATQDFFSHTNTKDATRGSTAQRGKLAGIANPAFAENIAYNYPVSGASYLRVAEKFMEQWMNSPGHRSNILSASGLQAGCGVYPFGGRLYGTQVFQWFHRVNTQTATDRLPPLRDGTTAKAEGVEYANLPDIEPETENKDNTQIADDVNKTETNKINDNSKRNTDDKTQKRPRKNSFPRLSFALGLGPSYHAGVLDGDYYRYNAAMVSIHGESYLGFNFKTKPSGARHTLAAFLKYGLCNADITQTIISQQNLAAYSYDAMYNFNYFRHIEGGLLVGRFWRLSGGLGRIYINSTQGVNLEYDYYTLTTGFLFHLGDIKWNISITGAGAGNFSAAQFILQTGLSFGVDFLKI